MTNTSNEKVKKKIKSFIYLDEYKMYSISSQIFEGLTEYVTNRSYDSSKEQETQKGPLGSGRVLADIITNESSVEERKFLHDYSYALFEDKLFKDNRVLQIDADNISEVIDNIQDYDFIKVKGRLLFNDFKLISETINNFNKLGEALYYITNFSDIDTSKYEHESNISAQAKSKSGKGFSNQPSKNMNNVSSLAEEAGLNMDQGFLDRLKLVLKYGYREQFEVISYLLEADEEFNFFSAFLKRHYLREAENLIISKYSRYSEKEFVVFGIVTQSAKIEIDLPISETSNPENMKQAISILMLSILGIEKQFTGKTKNEVMIDPIAVYREF
ncbi:MAG: hypothetical protein WBA77_09155 [Microcoleaceae cyanobacterium]